MARLKTDPKKKVLELAGTLERTGSKLTAPTIAKRCGTNRERVRKILKEAGKLYVLDEHPRYGG